MGIVLSAQLPSHVSLRGVDHIRTNFARRGQEEESERDKGFGENPTKVASHSTYWDDLAMCQMNCRMTHNTSATASASKVCQKNCEYVHIPLEIRLDKSLCHARVSHKFYKQEEKSSRTSGRDDCMLMAEFAYERGTMNYPQWLLNSMACRWNMTFTGSSPAARQGKPGCKHMPRGSAVEKAERANCFRMCYVATPVAARIYRLECEDDFRRSVPEDLSSFEEQM